MHEVHAFSLKEFGGAFLWLGEISYMSVRTTRMPATSTQFLTAGNSELLNSQYVNNKEFLI